MNRLSPEQFEPNDAALGGPRFADPTRPKDTVAGLLITCSQECFPPEALALELDPGAWLIHRNPGNIVPPFGTGHRVEEELLHRAIHELRVRSLVICGHHPCSVTAHLLLDGEPAQDFVLRDWLSHAEAARHILRDLPGETQGRAAAAHNVLTQLTNLRTHPAVAAALAQGRLDIWGWLHAGELLYPRPGKTSFDRLVAFDPQQNRNLRRERIRQIRPRSPGPLRPPYLA